MKASSMATEEMTGSREEPSSQSSSLRPLLRDKTETAELLTPLATSNTSVRKRSTSLLLPEPHHSTTLQTNRCIYQRNDGKDQLIASTELPQHSPRWLERIHKSHRAITVKNRIEEALERRTAVYNIQSQVQQRQNEFLTERERMNERLTLRDMVGEVGIALFDPLDLEHLRCEIPCDIRQDAATAPLLPPKLTVSISKPTLIHSISEPILSHSSPLATTKGVTSFASLTCATEQDSMHFSDEEEHYPVDIEPESASDLRTCPRLLTDSMIQQLHDSLPDALQMNKWERCFSIGRDGDSFLTFTNFCAAYQHTLIVIKTVSGHLLGGFATESWGGHRKKHSYYGTGQSFVFCDHPAVLPGYDADLDPSKELSLYSWSGDNNYCQICNVGEQKLAMGGVGDFGLIIQENFNRGQTGRCRTYNNPPLTPDLAGLFEIESFEVYGLAPLFQTTSPSPHFSDMIMCE
jgi:hypothetical protein